MRSRPAGGSGLRIEPVAQIEAAEVEGEFGPEGGEEAKNVVRGLGERVCGDGEDAVTQRAEIMAAGLVLPIDGAAVRGPLDRSAPGEKVTLVRAARCTQHIVDPLILSTQPATGQQTVAETQRAQMVGDLVEVGLVEFGVDGREEADEGGGAERRGMLVGERPESSEDHQETCIAVTERCRSASLLWLKKVAR